VVTTLTRAVTRYANRFHGALGFEHHVASPLGAWILLALAADGATDPHLGRLEDILGMDAPAAGAAARTLLGAPHEAVAAGAVIWSGRQASTGDFTDWLARVSPPAAGRPIPSPEDADAWAAKATGGLINAFPLSLDPRPDLVLASALATRVSWSAPFELAGERELTLARTGGWEQLRTLLAAPAAHRQMIVTAACGDVGVHLAEATNGLLVASVIAGPETHPGSVMAAAHQIAVAAAGSGTGHGAVAGARSLFELPCGPGPAWTIAERTTRTTSESGREENVRSLLPAWSATSRHQLGAHATLGFGDAAGALAALLVVEPEGYTFEAVQAATASYSRFGFEAAAVTAMSFMATGMPPRLRDGLARDARIEFTHPYAVVAVALDRGWTRDGACYGPWHGLPVFSGWVSSPQEAVPVRQAVTAAG